MQPRTKDALDAAQGVSLLANALQNSDRRKKIDQTVRRQFSESFALPRDVDALLVRIDFPGQSDGLAFPQRSTEPIKLRRGEKAFATSFRVALKAAGRIKSFGAQIKPGEAAIIIDYLANNYGARGDIGPKRDR
jgi:hypothetical protein